MIASSEFIFDFGYRIQEDPCMVKLPTSDLTLGVPVNLFNQSTKEQYEAECIAERRVVVEMFPPNASLTVNSDYQLEALNLSSGSTIASYQISYTNY